MSKLYTEYEVRILLKDLLGLDKSVNEAIDSLEPIELPTDEEISNNSPFKNATDYTKEEYYNFINFMNGAIWMRDKIGQ